MRRQPKTLPEKVRRQYQELQAITDPSRNMKAYRELFAARNMQPRLPFLPLHLKDLCFARETMAKPPSMDNLKLVTRLILDVLVWQPYRLRPDFGMQGYFKVSVPARKTVVDGKIDSEHLQAQPAVKADAVQSTEKSLPSAQSSAHVTSNQPSQQVASTATAVLDPVAAPATAHGASNAPPASPPENRMRTFALSNLTSPAVLRSDMRRRSNTLDGGSGVSAHLRRSFVGQ